MSSRKGISQASDNDGHPLPDLVNAPVLCDACPLRKLGLRNRAELVPGNGAVTTPRLGRGQMIAPSDLGGRYALVRSGSLKIEYLSDDGRPGVAAFLLPGEPVVALFSAVPMQIRALEDTVLCALDPALVLGGAERAGQIIHVFSGAVAAQAVKDQHRLLSARTGGAAERVLWFLQDLAERQGEETVRLAMPREDIAHYLELRPESISRALSDLEDCGAIARETPRRIRLTGERRSPPDHDGPG